MPDVGIQAVPTLPLLNRDEVLARQVAPRLRKRAEQGIGVQSLR
ncbi:MULTISPECIES: hypothetical protein [unclassified Saccharopolyspora]|nr:MULTISPECIES: hypothetical protein [unclassified Saccharopolyspora]